MGIGRWFPALLEQSKRFLIFHSGNIFFYRHLFKDVIDQLDVRIFLRVPHDVLKKRRHERHGYHTAGKNLPSFPRRDLTIVLFSLYNLPKTTFQIFNLTPAIMGERNYFHFGFPIMECNPIQKDHCGGTLQVIGKISFTPHTSTRTRIYSLMEM